MQSSSLIDAFGLQKPRVIAIVGGGGKSSLMAALGREFRQKGERVVMTTTTHIFRPEHNVYLGDDPAVFSTLLEQYGYLTLGTPMDEGRIKESPLLARLPDLADRVIIEADGTKGLPVKVPKAGEPVIPAFADTIIAVAGLSALGKPLGQVCHRPELATQHFGLSPEVVVTPSILAEILCSPNGQRKDIGQRRYLVLLNQFDAASRVDALETAKEIISRGTQRVVIGALQASPQDFTVLIH